MLRAALVSFVASLAIAGPAQAAVLSGETADPADGAGSAAQDLELVRAAFDPATGALDVTLRLRAPVSSAEDGWGAIHGVLYAKACGPDSGTELGRLESSTDPARDDAALNITRGTKTTSADGREVRLSVIAGELAGREVTCLRVALSRKRPLDSATVTFAAAPAQPPPGGDPAVQPPVIVLEGTRPLTLRLSRTGAGRIRLRGFLQPVALTVRGVRRPGGRTLLRGGTTAGARTPVAVPVRLTRAGRRVLHAGSSLRVRLTITAVALGAPEGGRSLPVTLRRR